MTVRRINLYAVCPFAILAAITLWDFIKGNNRDSTELFFLLFIMIVAWGIGVFVGLALSAIVKKESLEPYFYLAGHLGVIATIIILILNAMPSGEHRPEQRNVEDNHFLVNLEKNVPETFPVDYVRAAFRKLEANAGDPNSFCLVRYRSRWKDTIIASAPDTIRYVYFDYLKHKKLLFAKFTVLGENVKVNWMDTGSGSEQKDSTTKPGPWGRRANLAEVKKSLMDLPDSTRDKVLDILSN